MVIVGGRGHFFLKGDVEYRKWSRERKMLPKNLSTPKSFLRNAGVVGDVGRDTVPIVRGNCGGYNRQYILYFT